MKNWKPKDELDRQLLRMLISWILYFIASFIVYGTVRGDPTPKISALILLSLFLAVRSTNSQ